MPSEVIVPRPAATLMLVRDTPAPTSEMEVLMLRRNPRSTWVGGACVFPGGAVDPEDASPDIAALCTGLSDAEASRVLGLDSGGLGYFVAAVRECFEEAGILLAFGADGPVSFEQPDVAVRLGEHRVRLNAGEVGFAEILESEALHLELHRLGYFSHWITPEGSPRRYDTRFFVEVLPEGQEALHDDDEVVASLWLTPADALRRHQEGEIDLMLPTMNNLEAIGRFTHTGDLVRATAAASVPAILPRITIEEEAGVVRIVLPGDPAYATATGLPPGAPFPDMPARSAAAAAKGGDRVRPPFDPEVEPR